MKAFIALLALFAIVFVRAEPIADPVVDMKEFVEGILIGVGEAGDISNMLPCIKDGDYILKKFKEALEHLQVKYINQLIKGVIMCLEASRDLRNMLSDCLVYFPILKKLAEAFDNPEYMKIAERIMFHFPEYLVNVVKARTCMLEGRYSCSGEAIGEIYKIMFHAKKNEYTLDKMREFVSGLLEGINEAGDISELVPCIKQNDQVFENYRIALEYLLSRYPEDIRRGLSLFFDTTKTILSMLKDCMTGFPLLKRIAEYLVYPDYMRILEKIRMHFTQFMTDVTKARTCLYEGHYHCAGESIGDILEFIFLTY